MDFIKKLKKSAEGVPTPVWIAGVIIPGGLVAISVYVTYKASRKPDQTFRQYVDNILKKEKDNDRSKDRS